MSKGAGAIGSRGARAAVVRAIGRGGGLHATDYLRSGMRDESLAFWRARFAGKTAAEAQRIAERDMPAMHVALYRENGRTRVVLEDGRHRMQAAREAGATRIRVEARIVGERGASSSTWTGVVRI